jgi:hypothetical protein
MMDALWAQVAQRVRGGGGEGGGAVGDVTVDAVQRAVLRAAGFAWCVAFFPPFFIGKSLLLALCAHARSLPARVADAPCSSCLFFVSQG